MSIDKNTRLSAPVVGTGLKIILFFLMIGMVILFIRSALIPFLTQKIFIQDFIYFTIVWIPFGLLFIIFFIAKIKIKDGYISSWFIIFRQKVKLDDIVGIVPYKEGILRTANAGIYMRLLKKNKKYFYINVQSKKALEICQKIIENYEVIE